MKQPNKLRSTAEVEAIALWAINNNRSMIAALREHYHISSGAAVMTLQRARKRGAQIPYKSAETVAAYVLPCVAVLPVEQTHLMCACGHAVSLDAWPSAGEALLRHALTEHGRTPTRQERTPKERAA